MTRGLKNNNPLNIRHNGDTFAGEVKGDDKAFKTFVSTAYGYRAAFVTLHTYLVKYGRNTIEKIIQAWAPPSDGNHTDVYIEAVVKESGIDKEAVLTADDGEAYIKIVAAMSRVENGKAAVIKDVEAGFDLQSKLKK